MMTKFLFWFAGIRWREQYLNPGYERDLNKSRVFGMVILFPILIWAGIGYLIGDLMGLESMWAKLLCALISAAVVRLLEIAIINSPKSLSSFLLRAIIGILMAIIGSFLIDAKIFEKEINKTLYEQTLANSVDTPEARAKDQAIQFHNNLIQTDKDLGTQIENSVTALNELNGQIDTESSNGGCGPKCRELKVDAEKAQANIDNLRVEKNDMAKQIHEAGLAVTEAQNVYGESIKDSAGILERHSVLLEYLRTHPEAALLFWLVFGFLFILEVLVIATKAIFNKPTLGEIEEQIAETEGMENAKFKATLNDDFRFRSKQWFLEQ